MKLVKRKSGIFSKPEIIKEFSSVTEAVHSLAANPELFKLFFEGDDGKTYFVDFGKSTVGLLTASIDWLKEPAEISIKKALKAGYHALIP